MKITIDIKSPAMLKKIDDGEDIGALSRCLGDSVQMLLARTLPLFTAVGGDVRALLVDAWNVTLTIDDKEKPT